MTENLRYIGPTTAAFYHGEVYAMQFSVDKGFLWLAEEGQKAVPYESLVDLLQSWQPESSPYTSAEDNEANEGRAAYGFR